MRTNTYNEGRRKYMNKYQRDQRNAIASKPSKDKIKCLICGRWYKQVCTHVVQVHKITAREYRKQFGLDVKRGLLPDYLRQLYRKQVFENGTLNNLKAGKKNWFKKGQKGVGVYTRSVQTMERLHNQNKK